MSTVGSSVICFRILHSLGIPGVVQSKWHSKKKVTSQARALISKSSEENEFAQREEIYKTHRPELCHEFRSKLFRLCRKC